MMQAEEIEKLINESMPDAKVVIEDLRGDGHHYAVTVESEAFKGMVLADQHRMVFTALQGRVGGLLREMTLTTRLPSKKGESDGT
ncbi:MAG TPA: BolA family transcriptional regulator [Rhodospirillaceae bacterium]|nr:BolA family transcriptional regulator [Rhodospirillaceae bacterium]